MKGARNDKSTEHLRLPDEKKYWRQIRKQHRSKIRLTRRVIDPPKKARYPQLAVPDPA